VIQRRRLDVAWVDVLASFSEERKFLAGMKKDSRKFTKRGGKGSEKGCKKGGGGRK
jgi:hypothetical protein